MNRLKKLLPLLLVVLAMFYSTPRDAYCGCNFAAAANVKSSAHSCCEGSETPTETQHSCMSSSPGISLSMDCCNMTRLEPITLANTLHLSSDDGQFLIRVVIHDWLFDKTLQIPSSAVAQMNRAPPRLVGLGTSKTYLFKQTFLI